MFTLRPVDLQQMPVRPASTARLLFALALGVALAGLLAPASVLLQLKVWIASWLPWTWVAAIDQGVLLGGADKWVHLAIFLVLAGLGVRAWRQGWERQQLFLGLLLMAFVTESLQHFIPGRSASLGDVVADAAGTLLVALALRTTPPSPSRLSRRGS